MVFTHQHKSDVIDLKINFSENAVEFWRTFLFQIFYQICICLKDIS